MARRYTKRSIVALTEEQKTDLLTLADLDGSDESKIVRAAIEAYIRRRQRDLLAARQTIGTDLEAKEVVNEAA